MVAFWIPPAQRGLKPSITGIPVVCFSPLPFSTNFAPAFQLSGATMKNVFGLNVIFYTLTAVPVTASSMENDSTFNPSPSDVNRARMLSRTAKSHDRHEDAHKAE
jgi:hypothetical protein